MRDGNGRTSNGSEPGQAGGRPAEDPQDGAAVCETLPHPWRTRVRDHWRRMRAHVWGPAGSLVFHVVAVGVLLTCFQEQPVQEKYVIDITPPTDTPPPKLDVLPPPSVPPPPAVGEERETLSDPGGEGAPPPVPPTVVEVVDPVPILTDELVATPPVSKTVPIFVATTRTADQITRQVTAYNTDLNTTTGGGGDGEGEGGGGGGGGGTNKVQFPTERAVLLALRWLQHNQNEDGSWNGKAAPAMTALALLAFLGHGETPRSQEFGPTVYKAIRWLIANQEEPGRFKGRDGNDYSQPIAAYALCEAYALTQHPDVRAAAVRAIAVVAAGQQASGGFNYGLSVSTPRNDTSYTGWCIQALKAAKIAKLDDEVPALTSALKRGVAGLRLNADPGGGFGYDGPGRTGLSGVGVLGMQLLGAGRSAEALSTMKFLEPCTFAFDTPEKQPYGGSSPIYYWYYITQAKFHHDRNTFLAWNRQFSRELCRRQIVEKVIRSDGEKSRTVTVGHWQSPSKGEHSGGLVQDTALCALMLEVYYRYLPTYQKPETLPGELAQTPGEESVRVQIR